MGRRFLRRICLGLSIRDHYYSIFYCIMVSIHGCNKINNINHHRHHTCSYHSYTSSNTSYKLPPNPANNPTNSSHTPVPHPTQDNTPYKEPPNPLNLPPHPHHHDNLLQGSRNPGYSLYCYLRPSRPFMRKRIAVIRIGSC